MTDHEKPFSTINSLYPTSFSTKPSIQKKLERVPVNTVCLEKVSIDLQLQPDEA